MHGATCAMLPLSLALSGLCTGIPVPNTPYRLFQGRPVHHNSIFVDAPNQRCSRKWEICGQTGQVLCQIWDPHHSHRVSRFHVTAVCLACSPTKPLLSLSVWSEFRGNEL